MLHEKVVCIGFGDEYSVVVTGEGTCDYPKSPDLILYGDDETI